MKRMALVVCFGISVATATLSVLGGPSGPFAGGWKAYGTVAQLRLASLSTQERLTRASTPSSVAVDTTTPQRDISLDRPPLRVVRDPFPTFSAVVLDKKHDEIILQDENLFQIMAFDRTANTPATAAMTEPKRVIGGPLTEMEFNCALYVDPNSGDIYSVNNDTLDRMTVFSRETKGNTPPDRVLRTPHRTYGIAVDEANDEMFLTVQDAPGIVVYKKSASGNDKSLREISGNKTMLADAHGIGLDTKNGWVFAANYGSGARFGETAPGSSNLGYGGSRVLGSGYFQPPSINVYPIKANGDVAPIRVITGSKTMLNWPAHMYVDEEHGDLYVANDGNDSILVFKVTDEGNVAPTRVLSGPKTEIKNPTGVVVDNQHDEIIVANMGNHRATVYQRTANGDAAPIRRIRAGPEGVPALQIGNPGAVAFDSKRDEVLVPNCVAHPQIAVFDRFAKGGDAPHRVVFGQETKLSRTMHDIRYNEKRDEIYVGNPFAQALLTFRGDANGQATPIRIIQGPKTRLGGADTLEIDTVHEEIMVPQGNEVLIFPMLGNGDVAPLRIIKGGPKLGWRSGGGIAVDPFHDILVTDGAVLAARSGQDGARGSGKGRVAAATGGGDDEGGGGNVRNAILIFPRLADGETKPLRIITGPRTGIKAIRQMQIYPQNGWIIISQISNGGIPEPEGTFVGAWSIYDNGDVAPRWKINGTGGRMVMKKPRGVTLDPKHKEVIVSDMRLNAVLTFSFPEIFDEVAKP